MNRKGEGEGEQLKEATVQVDALVSVQVKYKDNTTADYAMMFHFDAVPVAVSDKEVELSVVPELNKLYQKGPTMIFTTEDKHTVIIDAEDIRSLEVTAVKVTRGGTDEQ